MNLKIRIRQGFGGVCRIWADEMRTTFKDEGILIFFILVPLFYPLLYSWIYTNEVVREVPVAVVDMSHSAMSREFARRFDASPDVRVAYRCNSLAEAKDLIGRQEAFGVVYFPTDFQQNVLRMEQSRVSVFCDMSFMLYYKAIFQTATAVAGEMNSKIQIERAGNWTEREDEISTKPLDFDEVQIFNSTGGYGNFIIPGVLMLIIQQTLLLGIGLSAGTDRERFFSRSMSARQTALSSAPNAGRHKSRLNAFAAMSSGRLSCLQVVSGRAMCYFMLYAVVAAYISLVVPRLFGFTSLLQPVDTFWFMLPYVLSCIFFSMTLSCAVRYREDIILVVVFTSVPFLFLSGVSWPQSAIPEFWQWLSCVLPSTFGVRGFVRMNTMGAVLADVKVEYVVLWVQTVVYFLTTCLAYSLRAKAAKTTVTGS